VAGTAACAVTGAVLTWLLFTSVFAAPLTVPHQSLPAPPPPPPPLRPLVLQFNRIFFGSIEAPAPVPPPPPLLPEPWRLAVLSAVGGVTVAAVELLGAAHAAGGVAGEGGGVVKARSAATGAKEAGGALSLVLAGAANDNVLIPVVTGAVMYAARGLLLGWT